MDERQNHQNQRNPLQGTAVAGMVSSLATGLLVCAGLYAGWRESRKLTADIQEAKSALETSSRWSDVGLKLIEQGPTLIQQTSTLILGLQELIGYVHKVGGVSAIMNREAAVHAAKQLHLQEKMNNAKSVHTSTGTGNLENNE